MKLVDTTRILDALAPYVGETELGVRKLVLAGLADVEIARSDAN